jgi:hypothetical protein
MAQMIALDDRLLKIFCYVPGSESPFPVNLNGKNQTVGDLKEAIGKKTHVSDYALVLWKVRRFC